VVGAVVAGGRVAVAVGGAVVAVAPWVGLCAAEVAVAAVGEAAGEDVAAGEAVPAAVAVAADVGEVAGVAV
jgi:hypothetical protein